MQERYGSYFGLDGNTLEKAKERIAEGVKNNKGADVMS
jgi:hypothetical protein